MEAKEAFDRFGVDGIMIGRAAVGKPWLFGHMKHYLRTGELLPEPTVSEKVDMARLQFSKSLEIKSEPVGIYEMRRHFSNYFKGLPHFKEMRLKLLTTLDVEEIFALLEQIREKYGDQRPEVAGGFWDEWLTDSCVHLALFFCPLGVVQVVMQSPALLSGLCHFNDQVTHIDQVAQLADPQGELSIFYKAPRSPGR